MSMFYSLNFRNFSRNFARCAARLMDSRIDRHKVDVIGIGGLSVRIDGIVEVKRGAAFHLAEVIDVAPVERLENPAVSAFVEMADIG